MGFSITLIESPNGESLHGCPNSRFPVSLCALAPLREIPTAWIRSRAPLPSMGLPRAGRGAIAVGMECGGSGGGVAGCRCVPECWRNCAGPEALSAAAVGEWQPSRRDSDPDPGVAGLSYVQRHRAPTQNPLRMRTPMSRVARGWVIGVCAGVVCLLLAAAFWPSFGGPNSDLPRVHFMANSIVSVVESVPPTNRIWGMLRRPKVVLSDQELLSCFTNDPSLLRRVQSLRYWKNDGRLSDPYGAHYSAVFSAVLENGELIWDFVVVSESMTNRGLVMGEGTSRHGTLYQEAASR
jgi:hypothetical protein